MKSIKRFIACTVSVLLLLAGLTSCGNLLLKDISEDAIVSSQTTQAPQNGTGSLSGTIAFDGAIPAQMLTPSSGARTAFPSTPLTTDNFTFFVKAEGPDVPTVTNTFSGNDFSLSGLVPGVGYTLTVWIFNGTNNTNSDDLLFSGSYAPVTLAADNPSLTLENPIVVKPVALPEGQTQPVTFDITSRSKSVSSFSIWIDGGDGETNQYLNKAFTYIEGEDSSTHNAELSLPTGAHALTFQFYQTVNNDKILVYSCKEVINVIKGFETYTWVKNGNAKHLTGDYTAASFVINDECLQQFARNTIYVDSTASGENKGTRYSPYTSLEQAILVADSTGTDEEKNILVASGTEYTLSNPLTIENKSINISTYNTSGNTGFTVKISDSYSFTVKKDFEVTGMTIQQLGGIHAKPEKGGFFNITSGTATFNNCHFIGGDCSSHGGAIATSANLNLNNCSFEDNTHTISGGSSTADAVFADSTAVITIGKGTTFYSTDYIILSEKASIKVDSAYDTAALGSNTIASVDFYNATLTSSVIVFTDNQQQYFTTVSDNYFVMDSGILGKKVYVHSNGSDETGDGTIEKPYKTIISAMKHNTGANFQTIIYVPNNFSETITTDTDTLFSTAVWLSVETYETTPGDRKGNATITVSKSIYFNSYSTKGTTEFHNITFTPSDSLKTLTINNNTKLFLYNCKFTGYKTTDTNPIINNHNSGTVSLYDCIFNNNFTSSQVAVYSENKIYIFGSTSFSSNETIQLKGSSAKIVLDEDLNLPQDTKCATVNCIDIDDPTTVFSGAKGSSWTNWFKTDVLYVGSGPSAFDDAEHGFSADKPFKTLQYALQQCNSTTTKTIWVKASSTPEDITQILISGIKADIKVTNDLTSNTIGGTKAYNFINQGNDGQFQINTNSKISFTGFIFTRTNNVGSGGFIGTSSSEVSFTNCKFQGATANENGGAIVNGSGTKLILDNCEFTNCTATTKNGGAIYNSGELILSDCTFSGNKASSVSNDIYHTGTSVTLKAGNMFGGGIKLDSDKMLTIAEALDVGDGTITVTPPSYTVGTQILDGDGMAAALSNNIIELADSNYIIDSEGKLHEIHLSVNKAYVSKADSENNRTVSIIKDTDQSSNGLTVQQVILKEGEETKATFTESPFIVPDALDAGDYTIEVTATYKGSTLSDTIVFEIIERCDTIGWLTTAPSSGEYYISREESFTQLADWIKSGNSLSGVTIVLDDDVSLPDNFSFGECTEYSALKPFSGTFDGNEHTLSNISIKQTGSYNYHGLFPKVTKGTIKNVILKGEEAAGSIAGLVDGNSLIENCISKITTIKNSTYNTGGLVADLRSGTIRNCINYSNVQSSNNFAGGIVGETGGNSYQCYIESCMNYGNITCDGFLVGGICGEINSKCDIVNCANYGALTGYYSVGGIVGKICSWGTCHISNNITIGQITLTSENSLCGLLAGAEDKNNNVQYLYNYCLNLDITHDSAVITPSTKFFPVNAVTEGCTGEDTFREPNYLFTHTGSDNTITEQVTVGGTTTSELLEALNAWIDSQSTPSQYGYWINDTDASSPTYGYPVLDIQ